jgi:hypothetical protein
MTNRELADAAWLELTKTTDPFPKWVSKGKPASSHWAKAKGLLDQVTDPAAPPPPTPTPPPTTNTRILFAPTAQSELDPVMNTTDPASKQYVNDHYHRIIKLWGSKWATFYKNGHVYIDLLAIYRNSNADFSQILHNAAGKPLYIPYGCSGGVCPQWSADPGNAAFRANQIKRCKDALAMGYVGVHLDDVNLGFNFSDGYNGAQQPVGYTVASYNDAVVSLLEEIRKAIPTAEISHNARWFDSPNHDGKDPFVERQIKAADFTTIERGIVDGGLTGGTGSWSVDRLFSYVDHIHELGRSAVWMSYADSAQDTTANIAAYLLCRENEDMVSSHLGAYPANPFAPYNLDPGKALGVRTKPSTDVWQREFEHATARYTLATRSGTVTAK